ncbi:MAG: MBL fold metallo-hydrolase, partial [Methanosarcinales archaeon]
MPPSLRFLGTKGEIEEWSRTHKRKSGLLLEARDTKILFDCGDAKHLDEKPDFVVITHAHPDHTDGLVGLAALGAKQPIVFVERGTELLYRKYQIRHLETFEPWKEFKVDGVSILPVRVHHSVKVRTVGFKVVVDRWSFGYFPDVLSIEKMDEVLRDLDLYIGDGASISRSLVRRNEKYDEPFGHASMKIQLQWAKTYKIPHVVFTHFGKEAVELGDANLLKRLLAWAGDVDVSIAKDGMEYSLAQLIQDIESYNASAIKDTRVLMDDWRIACAWYSSIKKGKRFKYTEEQVVG